MIVKLNSEIHNNPRLITKVHKDLKIRSRIKIFSKLKSLANTLLKLLSRL